VGKRYTHDVVIDAKQFREKFGQCSAGSSFKAREPTGASGALARLDLDLAKFYQPCSHVSSIAATV